MLSRSLSTSQSWPGRATTTTVAVSPFRRGCWQGCPDKSCPGCEMRKSASSGREPVRWRPASGVPAKETILRNPKKKFSGDSWFRRGLRRCGLEPALPTRHEKNCSTNCFHPSEMKLNVCCTCIGSSDYSTKIYSYDESGAGALSIEHDRRHILPILRGAGK